MSDIEIHPKSAVRAAEPEQDTAKEELGHEAPDVMPNGGYGWVVAFCIFGINSVTWGTAMPFRLFTRVELMRRPGINTTYGVYSAYYLQNNHFAGGSTFRYAWVGGLSVGFALAVAPLVNLCLQRMDFRAVMLCGQSRFNEEDNG